MAALAALLGLAAALGPNPAPPPAATLGSRPAATPAATRLAGSDPTCGAGTPMRLVPGGPFRAGSDGAEREAGYRLSPPAVRQAAWYDRWEQPPHESSAGPVCLDLTPVTRNAYRAFVKATGRPIPDISRAAYERQGFLVHGYGEVERFRWRDGAPPPATGDHPVVLVSRAGAEAYCAWRGRREGRRLRLPTEEEWEKGARGTDGRWFPWGSEFERSRARTGEDGEAYTAPVDAHPAGASPYGLLDMAGNVFQWTQTPFDEGRTVLKGCGWDDAPGTCRAAFRHGRPPESRHILIGFRCAGRPSGRDPWP